MSDGTWQLLNKESREWPHLDTYFDIREPFEREGKGPYVPASEDRSNAVIFMKLIGNSINIAVIASFHPNKAIRPILDPAI